MIPTPVDLGRLPIDKDTYAQIMTLFSIKSRFLSLVNKAVWDMVYTVTSGRASMVYNRFLPGLCRSRTPRDPRYGVQCWSARFIPVLWANVQIAIRCFGLHLGTQERGDCF